MWHDLVDLPRSLGSGGRPPLPSRTCSLDPAQSSGLLASARIGAATLIADRLGMRCLRRSRPQMCGPGAGAAVQAAGLRFSECRRRKLRRRRLIFTNSIAAVNTRLLFHHTSPGPAPCVRLVRSGLKSRACRTNWRLFDPRPLWFMLSPMPGCKPRLADRRSRRLNSIARPTSARRDSLTFAAPLRQMIAA